MPDKRQDKAREAGRADRGPSHPDASEGRREHVARLAEAVRSKDRSPARQGVRRRRDAVAQPGLSPLLRAEAAGAATMDVEVVKGSRRDALADAMADNAEHLALPRSNADKRRAVMTALATRSGQAARPRDRQTLRGEPHIRCHDPCRTRFRGGPQGCSDGLSRPCSRGQRCHSCADRRYGSVRWKRCQSKPRSRGRGAISGGNVASPPAAPAASAGRETGPQQPSPPESIPLDQTGRPVPEWLRPAFAARSSLLELAGDVSLVKRRLGEINKGEPGGAFLDMQDIGGKADALHFLIKRDMPHAVCRLCGGRKGGCDACDKQGWLPKERYEATTPKELKDPPPAGGRGGPRDGRRSRRVHAVRPGIAAARAQRRRGDDCSRRRAGRPRFAPTSRRRSPPRSSRSATHVSTLIAMATGTGRRRLLPPDRGDGGAADDDPRPPRGVDRPGRRQGRAGHRASVRRSRRARAGPTAASAAASPSSSAASRRSSPRAGRRRASRGCTASTRWTSTC
jgi:hypothetical protein